MVHRINSDGFNDEPLQAQRAQRKRKGRQVFVNGVDDFVSKPFAGNNLLLVSSVVLSAGLD